MRAAAYWFVVVAVLISLPRHGARMPSLKEMALADAARAPPAWLQPLLETTFFEECPDHPLGASRGTRSAAAGCNFFCTDCPDHALCTTCLAAHAGHKFIQIRKSSNHAVVRVADVEALLNVSDVQPYLQNGHYVVFLNERPMAGHGRAGEFRCDECDRALLDAAYSFCSIGCKLKAMPEDLDFIITFAVQPKSDSESGDSDGSDADRHARPTRSRSMKLGRGSAQEGDGRTSAASKQQTTMAGEPSSGQQHQSKGVAKNI